MSVEITPTPSDDEAAAITVVLESLFEKVEVASADESRWKMSGRQYDEDHEALSR